MNSKIPRPITEIRIAGYKSLAKETKLEIRPLTILAGANSSGKSSVMQPLLLLKQTLASPSDPGVIDLAGPNVEFSQFGQMFYKCPGNKDSAKTMGFGFTTSDGKKVETLDLTYRLSQKTLKLESQSFTFAIPGMPQNAITLRPGPLTDDEVNSLPGNLDRFVEHFTKNRGQSVRFIAAPSRGFVDLILSPDVDSPVRLSAFLIGPAEEIQKQLLALIHIPGLRGNPRRVYPLRKTSGPRFDGHFQDYVAGIVADWRGDDRLNNLSESLKLLGLTWKVEAKDLDATRVEIVVGRLRGPKQGGAKDLVNIADVGFGVSQILPVLVALEVAVPGQMIHLEQPEIHLHPRAQKNLAKVLADAATKGKRLVIETHSSILIRGIQTLVAKGELDPEIVKLHWFTRDDETGITHIDSADLDENGAFGGEWPEDFDDTYLESEKAYLDAVEARYTK